MLKMISKNQFASCILGDVFFWFFFCDQFSSIFLTKKYSKSTIQIQDKFYNQSRSFVQCLLFGEVRNDGDFWKGSPPGEVRFSAHQHYPWSTAHLFIIGGNTGKDTDEFLSRFNPDKIDIFEPIPDLANALTTKFFNKGNIHVHNFGLDSFSGEKTISFGGNGNEAASVFTPENSLGSLNISIRRLSNVISELIDVSKKKQMFLSINCEGCEYGLLEDLIEAKSPFEAGHLLIELFDRIQLSRHNIAGVPFLVPRYCRIQEFLHRFFKVTYMFPWVWEAWERS